IRLDNVPKAGILVEIEADEAQRASLAADHGLLEVCSFHAEISVSHWRRNGFRLEGLIRAEIVQQCSVSLEPIPARLEIPVDNFLVQEDSYLDRSPHGLGEELMLSVDSEDEPETYSGNRFDVGALVEELFVLSLDP